MQYIARAKVGVEYFTFQEFIHKIKDCIYVYGLTKERKFSLGIIPSFLSLDEDEEIFYKELKQDIFCFLQENPNTNIEFLVNHGVTEDLTSYTERAIKSIIERLLSLESYLYLPILFNTESSIVNFDVIRTALYKRKAEQNIEVVDVVDNKIIIKETKIGELLQLEVKDEKIVAVNAVVESNEKRYTTLI